MSQFFMSWIVFCGFISYFKILQSCFINQLFLCKIFIWLFSSKMSNNQWTKEIDGIIQDNIAAIGHVFKDIKSQTNSNPIDPVTMIEVLNSSEKLWVCWKLGKYWTSLKSLDNFDWIYRAKEICIGFITDIVKWIRKESNCAQNRETLTKSNHIETLQKSFQQK